MSTLSRRAFLGALAVAGSRLATAGASALTMVPAGGATVAGPFGEACRATSRGPLDPIFPVPSRRWHGGSSLAFAQRHGRVEAGPPGAPPPGRRDSDARIVEPAPTLARFADLRRHFVFEYYPWYASDPWMHWDEADRVPPDDIAATSYPWLGPYDSRSRAVVEQHARWIAEAGIGAVNLSWWGRDTFTDRAVTTIMDVMAAHDIHVTFHLEPYRTDRGAHLAEDLLYLVRQYGDRRGWDAMLLPQDASGRSGPVFKLFAAILPRTATDCLGRVSNVAHHVDDAAWRRQLDVVRRELARDFDHVRVLADSLDMTRTRASGFDGVAIYDNFHAPSAWARDAAAASSASLVFSFNVNAGFDRVEPRNVQDPCYRPLPFEPGGRAFDWSSDAAREEAMRVAIARIEESFRTTLALQLAPGSANARRGFLLVYVNSFNEWHEGTQFEPARAARDLTAAQRALYHNAPVGDYRLRTLQRLLGDVTP
jgi:hypothetical protein